LAAFAVFKKLPKVNNCPKVENSSNPVTLASNDIVYLSKRSQIG
jgi:hypothetical protein